MRARSRIEPRHLPTSPMVSPPPAQLVSECATEAVPRLKKSEEGTDHHSSADLPLLLAVEEVARLLDVSERTVYRLRRTGELSEPVALRGCKRWPRREIEEYVAAKASGNR